MSSMKHPAADALSAFVDGELDGSELRTVEAHLSHCTPCERTVGRLRVLKDAVRRVASEDARVPTALEEKVLAMASAPRPRWALPKRAVLAAVLAGAAAALVAILVGLGSRRAGPLPSALRDELALDHLHYAPLANPAQVASGDPAVVAAGLRERLGRAVVVPSWEATTLIGGRACQIQSQWVSLVLYERAGRRISFFELPRAELHAPGCDRGEGGLAVCAVPGPSGGAFVAVADLPDHELSRLLHLASGS